MRAISFRAAGELALEERPEPVAGHDEVLVETAAVGICGTDIHVFDGEFGAPASRSSQVTKPPASSWPLDPASVIAAASWPPAITSRSTPARRAAHASTA